MKKWLKLLFVTSALAIMGVLACTGTSRGYVRVCAEGEETSEVVEEQPQEAEEEKGWVKKSYETYIVPLLSGVSLTSIVSAVTCIVMTIIKNNKLDKKLVSMREEQDRRDAEANQKLLLAEQKLAEVTEILQINREIYKIILENDAINKDVKKIVLEKLSLMTSIVEKQGQDISKIEKLQQVVALLVQLQSKVALQSQEVIKSGIIDDVNNILQLVKSI